MSREDIRKVALGLLGEAHKQRNAAEGRLWAARDHVTELRLRYLEAQANEAISQREFDRAQELLHSVWSEFLPLGDPDKTERPESPQRDADPPSEVTASPGAS